MDEGSWKTGITSIKPNEIRLRGYRIDEMMGRVSFAGGVFLLFHGRLPTAAEEKLYDAMMLASIDHGVTPPSAQAARLAASTGAPLNGALAAGVLSINQYHGAAIEPAMRMFLDAA
jgi:citrate synthase